MRWVRSNLKFGSWCALFALAFQVLVVFNHVHCTQNLCWPSSPTTVESLSHATDGAATSGRRAAPAIGEYCVLCAVIHLAGTLLPATPPQEPTGIARPKSLPWADLADIPATVPHGNFQARAPPRA
ncbi:MAG: hypothetical protein JO228_10250 [Xanthobacteraceae bacterium]|nr:hypothetical protein [Xanthobacteraceae bacterium]